MKKLMKIIVPAACLIAAFASFGVTYSYLIANDAKLNEFSVGENDIEIIEEFEAPEELKPGITFPKEPSVRNTGDLPCLVRMRVDFSDSNAEDFCVLKYDGNYGVNRTGGWTDKYKYVDGYYYYTKILQPGESTPPLFDEVYIKDEKDQEGNPKYEMIDFDIMIYVESKEWRDTYAYDDDIDDVDIVDKIKEIWGGK